MKCSVFIVFTTTVLAVTSSCIIANSDDVLFYNITVIAEENINGNIDFDVINVNFYNFAGGFKKSYTGLVIRRQQIYDIQCGAVSNLPWIQYVRFEDSEIESIEPDAFFNLPSLTVLSITDNLLLRNITHGVFNCVNLNELYLYNNSIEYISSYAFAGVPNLEILGLDMNNIKRMNYKWFLPTKYLYIVFLNDNKLSKIREKDLKSLQGVIYNGLKLHFARNKIRKLEQGVLRGKLIDDLNLSENNLKTLSFRAFEDVIKLRHINLTGNDIVCTHRKQLITLFSIVQSITKNDGWDESCIPIV